MDPFLRDFLGPILGMITIGSFFLVALKMRYTYRAKLQEGGAGKQDVERLTDQVEAMRDQVIALRDDVTELYERVEFAERLLARGKTDQAS